MNNSGLSKIGLMSLSAKGSFDFDKLDRFLRYTNKSESFVDFVERRIEERGDITESTKASHRTFAASLREFDRIIYFSDLTKANITLYDDWLHAKGYSQPTIYNYHKRNKRYIHEAIKFDLLKMIRIRVSVFPVANMPSGNI